MKILHYDPFAGISGDMNLAALIDLGVSPAHLRCELDKLGLGDEFDLDVSTDARNAIHGTRVDVRLRHHHHGDDAHDGHGHDHDGDGHSHGHDGHDHHHGDGDHAHGHDDGHGHGHSHGEAHGHDDGGEHVHGHNHHHGHRNLADITAIIEGSGLDEAVKKTSLKLFGLVAAAEARVHGTTVDQVHFHEVGATDSIVDIVGAAICLHSLGVDEVWASPVELGGGFVRCAHGVMPVPAPATEAILHGVPTTRGGAENEATTPTGAAIVAGLADRFVDAPRMAVRRTGYGIGHRETELPNVLRVHLAETDARQDDSTTREARLLQCNIDDMTAEALGATMELLMECGAMDVHFTPIQMKKNRPATCVSLLCAPDEEERFKGLLFRHTATLGIKSFRLEKTELERSFTTVQTPLGPVTLKNAHLGGEIIRSKPEFSQCQELARRNGISLAEVYAIVERSRK